MSTTGRPMRWQRLVTMKRCHEVFWAAGNSHLAQRLVQRYTSTIGRGIFGIVFLWLSVAATDSEALRARDAVAPPRPFALSYAEQKRAPLSYPPVRLRADKFGVNNAISLNTIPQENVSTLREIARYPRWTSSRRRRFEYC